MADQGIFETHSRSSTRLSFASSRLSSVQLYVLECVSKRKIRKFEWILRQFKEETRRLSSAKSRVDDAEMAQKTPKLRIREFLRHTLECVSKIISSKKSCKQNMNSRQNDKTIEALGQLIKAHSNAAELLYL